MIRCAIKNVFRSQVTISANYFSTTGTCLRRGRGQSSLIDQQHLEIFRNENHLSPEKVGNVHLNPAAHFDVLNQKQQVNICPDTSRRLRVNILGVPNSGKSTLINQLVGYNVCAHSKKVHTTRQNARAILTEGETQIVFLDTPGVVSSEDSSKFKLEPSLIFDPASACLGTDLIILLQDVSNRYVREALDKQILKLLCYNFKTPCVLVLNKIDTIPKSRRIYDLIRKLTCGYLEGIKQEIKLEKQEVLKLDTYLKKKRKLDENKNKASESNPNEPIKIQSYDDFMQVLKRNPINDDLVNDLIQGLVGWPNFKDVFTVSALNGDGVTDLRNYLFNAAYSASWDFPSGIFTDDDPRETVVKIVKSKFLEVLPTDIPYKVTPKIQTWKIENGVLRLGIQVDSATPRSTALMLGNQAANLAKIGKLTETDLQNFFQCEVFVMLSVNVTHQSNIKKPPNHQKPEFLYL